MNEKKQNVSQLKVGYIGVGLMGHGVAKNILEKGKYQLMILDPNKEPVKNLVNSGATEAKSISDLTLNSDIIFMCLPSAEVTKNLVYSKNGLLENLRGGMIVVDSSTTLPEATESFAKDFTQMGVGMVDAPLGGGPEQAEKGSLASYLGGEAKDIERILPIIECYSNTIISVGPVGSAMKIKILNNYITVSNCAVIAEAVATGERLGIDFKKLYEVVSSSGANSQIFQWMMPWLTKGDTEKLKGKIRIGYKDLGYYSKLAESVNAVSFVGSSIQQVFKYAIENGYGDEYLPELFNVFSSLNGDKIKPIS